jgi:hypothetical protein
MKYIKTFETKKEYKVGDIVVFKFQRMHYQFDIKIGIIKKQNTVFENWYDITDLDNTEYGDLATKKSHILKKATQKDIDNYMMEPNAKKYNL